MTGGTRQERPEWHKLCQRKGGKGEILNNVHNALIALRDGYGGMLAFDEMAMRVMLKALPGELAFDEMRQITDTDETIIQNSIQAGGFPMLGKQVLSQAIALVALDASYHPVRDWLKGLAKQWDGVPRTATWLANYLGSKQDPDYLKLAGQFFLLAMVARVMEPGCQSDHMMMLEGPQGIYKSKACGVLAGEWFSENLPSLLHEKDVSIHIAGKWLIEVPELHALPLKSIEKVKAFISRRVERYVPKFMNHDKAQPRQCVFVGTTNSDQYLHDDENRRFWSIRCGKIDIDGLERDREQLFAETMVLWWALGRRDERRWWPKGEAEISLFEKEQEERRLMDPLEEAIRKFFDDPKNREVDRIDSDFVRFEIMQITDKTKWGIDHTKQVSKVMKLLGWETKRTKSGNSYTREVDKKSIY